MTEQLIILPEPCLYVHDSEYVVVYAIRGVFLEMEAKSSTNEMA